MRFCNETDREFAQLVRKLRQEAGMSQMSMGHHLGVSFQQIQKYEAAKNRLSIGRAKQIADALGVRLSDLIAEVD